MTGPTYSEAAPRPELSEWIECYWSIRGHSSDPIPNRVLPDGCSDLILGIRGMGPAVVGTMRAARLYPVVGPVDLFGVRFRPGGSFRFLGVPLWELTDQRVPLDDLWGSEALLLADAADAVTLEERVARAERVLLARLRSRAARRTAAEELAGRGVALLRRARGGVGVREVAAALGVGERRLQRAFDHAVGVGPKALAGVLRFRRLTQAIAAASERGPIPWAALAAEAGYADQPHLVREFKRLAGLTPAQYLAERAGVGFVQDPDEGSP